MLYSNPDDEVINFNTYSLILTISLIFFKGDGGSPLVCSINSGPYQVVGLVSWGIGCADGGVPGVYTNVYNFVSWIQQQAT